MTQTAGQSSVSTDTEGPAGRCTTGVNRRGTEPERWWTVGTLRGSGQHCPPLSLSAELCARRTHMQVLGLRPCGRRLIWKWGLRRQERLGWVALGWGRAGRALTQRPASLHRARTRRPRGEGRVTTGAGPGAARARGMPAAPGSPRPGCSLPGSRAGGEQVRVVLSHPVWDHLPWQPWEAVSLRKPLLEADRACRPPERGRPAASPRAGGGTPAAPERPPASGPHSRLRQRRGSHL